MAAPDALVAAALHKRYGDQVAVVSFDLALRPGRIVGLVGNNGAGKSTVLKMLCGLLDPTKGRVHVAGRVATTPAAKAHIGFVPEDSPLYEELTPLRLLAFFARLHGIQGDVRDRSAALLRRMRLDEEHWGKPIGALSKGSARKVALARALLHDPDVLLLDEPASGLDPATRTELEEVLVQEAARGVAVLLSAHDMDQVERLCDHVLLMHQGRVRAQGTLAELRAGLGPAGYRVVADRAFAGAHEERGGYVATARDEEGLWPLLDAARAAGAQEVEAAPVRPGLQEILARLEAS